MGIVDSGSLVEIDCKSQRFSGVANKAMTFLILQGEQCIDEKGNFCYGNEKGHHCPLGLLLEEGSAAMNSLASIDTLLEKYDLGHNHGFIKKNIRQLRRLQLIHDDVNGCNEDDIDNAQASGLSRALIDQWSEMSIRNRCGLKVAINN